MRDTFFWSDADKDKVAALLVQGLSASQIAAQFDGVSRSAIIGVIYRDARLKAIGLAKSPGFAKPKSKPSPSARVIIRKARQASGLPAIKSEIAAPAPLNLPLHELDKTQCKWPVNDVPRGGRFLFCGHQRAETGPYCAYHHSRAFRVDSVDR